MNDVDKFLTEYLKTEGLLKQAEGYPDTVLDYEGTLDQEASEKLRLCRQIRNYCRHHEDYKKFISVSVEMVKFVQKINSEIEISFAHCSDKAQRIPPLTLEYKLQDAVMLAAKKEYVPIISPDVVCVLDSKAIVRFLAGGVKPTARLKTIFGTKLWKDLPEYTILHPDERLDKVHGLTLLLDEKGKYKGMIRPGDI